jgi:hypothetical protein
LLPCSSPLSKLFSNLGLTQLVGEWGCLGGRSPPKHPIFHHQLRNFYNYWFFVVKTTPAL